MSQVIKMEAKLTTIWILIQHLQESVLPINHLLTQGDLNVIVRDLNLSKKQAEILGSRLKRSSAPEVCFYRGRLEEFKDFFSQEDGVVFCNDVCSVMEVLGHEYNPDQRRFLIDSSKVSLKLVLLHDGNRLPSVPLAHAANMKER